MIETQPPEWKRSFGGFIVPVETLFVGDTWVGI